MLFKGREQSLRGHKEYGVLGPDQRGWVGWALTSHGALLQLTSSHPVRRRWWFILNSFVKAIITKYHRWGGLDTVLEVRCMKSRCQYSWFSEASLTGLQMATFSLGPHMVFLSVSLS